MEMRVQITGFGGQGVITAGFILGQAAAIYDDLNSTFVQSYGPEARGSACSSQITISDEPILYPYIKQQDFLVAMSQEGFDKFARISLKGSLVVYDEDLVVVKDGKYDLKFAPIPATRIAEKKIGKRIVANIVILGYLVAQSQVVTLNALEKAVLSAAPKGTEKINEDALRLGLTYGKRVKK